MDAQSTICLSDLVPALRWSRPQQIAEILADPRLPGGWWDSVTISHTLGVTGVDWLCERLARLAVTRWDHLPLIEILPALQVHTADPALPGWPDSARALAGGVGGWFRLRRLTPADLRMPQTNPELVIGAAFREVFSRLAVATPQPPVQQPAQQPVQQPVGPPVQQPAGPPVQQAGPPVQQPAGPQPASQPGQLPAEHTGPHAAPAQHTGPRPVPAEQTGPHAAPIERTGPQQAPAAAAHTGPQPVQRPAEPAAQPTDPAPTPAKGFTAIAQEHPMVGLVEALLRSWNPLEKAIAAERLFAADPISLRALAYRLNVDREVLSHAQRSAEERVLMWMRSPDSAALTGHLFGLSEWLGAAATQEQLISVDPSHPIEVPTLGTPLWRVLVALMADRRLQDGWLVVGDLGGLQERTRRLLAEAPPDADMIELLGQIGIRSHSAKAWLDSLPPEGSRPHPPAAHEINGGGAGPAGANGSGANGSGSNGSPSLPRRTPGANGHPRGGLPVPNAGNNVDAETALAALSALASGAGPRPHLVHGQQQTPPPVPGPAADPRRWQRIDVTSEHLRGGPVAVPEGYAAQLGMRPGTLLSVTGPGDNAVVLVWRDRQPVFDSLQPVLMRLNARPGDSVYVTVNGYRLDAQLTS